MSRPLLSRLAWVLPLLLALVPAAGARAAEVAFTGVLPNGALYTTPVQSMRENRYANLVRQQTDYSCGAASLATILSYAFLIYEDVSLVIDGLLSL